MTNLKPCPFCGGKAQKRYRLPMNWIECRKCGGSTRAYSDWDEQTDGMKEAIEAWNRRVEDGK